MRLAFAEIHGTGSEAVVDPLRLIFPRVILFRAFTELLEADPELRQEWDVGSKLDDDPRVVPGVGRFLRRFSIDELPQLLSVVKGDMSLVGRRPFPAYHLKVLEPRARRLRAQVRPGVSGLWQVAARGEADLEVQESYDLYYIRNRPIWLDLYILSRTVSAVVMEKGAR